MKVSKEFYELSEKILDHFDADRIKSKHLTEVEREQAKVDKKLEELTSQTQIKDTNTESTMKTNYEKWDMIEKKIDLEEK